MLIVTYDISNDKLRTRFSTYLAKFGYRLQYSIFEIKNTPRVLANVIAEIEGDFEDEFGPTDSILIFNLSKQCKISRYGYAKTDDDDLIIV